MIGIILAAGDGTRFKKSSDKENCKMLSTINGKFLLEFALDNLKTLDVTTAFVVVGECAETIKKEIGYKYNGITVHYVNQPVRKGMINALIQAVKIIAADDIVLQLADEIFIDFRSDEVIRTINENKNYFMCGITYEKDLENRWRNPDWSVHIPLRKYR